MREVDNYLESGVWFWVCWEGTWLRVTQSYEGTWLRATQSYEIEGYTVAS